jgi:hypothetical protein
VTGTERQEARIPDQIVIIREGEIPSIASFGLTMLWMGPLALIISIGLVLWLIFRSSDRVTVFKILGGTLSITALIAIILTRWYEPVVLTMFRNGYTRTIGEAILQEFLISLTRQNIILLLFGLLLIGGALLYQNVYVPNRHVSKNSTKK